MKLQIPAQVTAVLSLLEHGGFEACVVGGCVRDSLMGLTPHDWDVATSALPEQTMRALASLRLIETGRKHGTITAVSGGMAVEVTTYRVDGAYSDNRRPDNVRFTPHLRDDLARRDFTINALAYSPRTGLTDCFGGAEDLQRGVLRCVGNPDTRFGEDALRILRGLRFAAVLGFTIQQDTAASILQNRWRLGGVSAERVFAELTKLLCGKNACDVLLGFPDVFTQMIPELAPCVGFDQRNPHHRYTVYEHLAHAVGFAPPEPAFCLALLLHDIAKPAACTADETGICHFYGHAKVGADLAAAILTRLRASSALKAEVCALIEHHDIPISPDERLLRRRLNQFGATFTRKLLAVKRADCLSRGIADDGSIAALDKAERTVACILAQGQCFALRDLAVNGNDLIAAGMPEGAQVGAALRTLLGLVVDGKCQNSKAELLAQIGNT